MKGGKMRRIICYILLIFVLSSYLFSLDKKEEISVKMTKNTFKAGETIHFSVINNTNDTIIYLIGGAILIDSLTNLEHRQQIMGWRLGIDDFYKDNDTHHQFKIAPHAINQHEKVFGIKITERQKFVITYIKKGDKEYDVKFSDEFQIID
jgi:hypothetical protein